MRRRHLAVIIPALGIVSLIACEGERAYAAWLLHRGDFARLERLDSERYFVPAVRAHTLHPRRESALLAWATRRFQAVVPGYVVCDLRMHSSGLIVAAFSLNSEECFRRNTTWGRLVAIEPRERRVVSDTGELDLGGGGFGLQLADIDGDGVEEILLIHGGCGVETGFLYRLSQGRFVEIPAERKDCGIWSRGGFTFIDLDHDGILEIRCYSREEIPCPCGRESQVDEVTWRLFNGRYCPWTIRGSECGPECERPYTWPRP